MILLLRPFSVFVLLAGAASALAAGPPGPTDVPPGPEVAQYAAVHGIPLEGFELAGTAEPPRIGDRISVLFTIQEGGNSRQWLAEFRFAAPTDREAKSKPGSGLGLLSMFQVSLHTDTGHEYSFSQTPAALEIRTFGPFPSSGTAPEVKGRVLATSEYLTLGLAPMGEIELRIRAAGKKNSGVNYMFLTHFSDERVAATRARALAAGFTEDDERTCAEGIFALVQFANLAFRTDGVNAITREIADAPTLFSGALVDLQWARVQPEDGGAWGLPGVRILRLPYTFNSKTQARGTFYVTAARPPLENIAGIVGLTVDSTSKTPGKRLIMRVVAGRRGGQ